MIYIPVGLTGKGTGSPRQLTAHKDSCLTVLCRNPDGAWAADAAQPSEHGALRSLMDPILESRQKNPKINYLEQQMQSHAPRQTHPNFKGCVKQMDKRQTAGEGQKRSDTCLSFPALLSWADKRNWRCSRKPFRRSPPVLGKPRSLVLLQAALLCYPASQGGRIS